MSNFVYEKDRQRNISFPVGGLGTGSIGIAGNGCLIDWQIYNRPAVGSRNGYTHFAVKAQDESGLLDARVLVSNQPKPYMEAADHVSMQGMHYFKELLHSNQVDERTMMGMPHFRELNFKGTYPKACLSFLDERFPGEVKVEYYNPLIPLNDKDSGLPALFADIHVNNTLDHSIYYTVAGVMANPGRTEYTSNHFRSEDGIQGIYFVTDQVDQGDVSYSDFSLATYGDCTDSVSYQECWYRGGWRDHLETYWREFASVEPLENRSYSEGIKNYKDTGILCSSMEILPGEEKVFHFVITWNVPNCNNFWSGLDISTSNIHYDVIDRTPWKNYYATLFADSWATAAYALKENERLSRETDLFMDAIYGTTIPETALEAVTANIAVLRSPTCLRLEDGSFYGWEGCWNNVGSCEGTCTHVWNYAYALPFLFPKLARSIRDLEYKYSQRADGGINFRLRLPLGSTGHAFHSCVDGQMGAVMLTWRDYLISGDKEWLAKNWESTKRAISYAWSEENIEKWDSGKKGWMDGRQHHTLDMELFGPNGWLQGFYVGGLLAGAEMAKVLGDTETEAEYRDLAEKGKKYLNRELFNGEYFCQKADIHDKSILEPFGKDAVNVYWNDEKGQIKYQIAGGCSIDQVLSQWHANLMGLGEIYEKDKVRSALCSIYRYNYKPEIGAIYNPWRLFAVCDESGTIMCEWPEHVEKPAIPLTYAQECMDGFQYQVAGHMIQEGMLEEGETLVKAIRGKYQGDNRNPWCEVECGGYYARSMASYALLLSYSGFTYDAAAGKIGFRPASGAYPGLRAKDGAFRSFWSLDSGWGTVEYFPDGKIVLNVLYGKLELERFVTGRSLAFAGSMNFHAAEGTSPAIVNVLIDGREVSFTQNGDEIQLVCREKITGKLEVR
ncbi:MAG: hypothetical protein IJ390_02520 [Lachnospiraceae bacterium]|nr:hypothetical protein [Lachnospiraceae bacterium]